jgi:hypothetical protein
MLLGELLLGQLAGVVPGNPLRSLFCVAMPLTLRSDSFHTASFAPTSDILKMHPAYRLRLMKSYGPPRTFVVLAQN